MYRNNSDSLRRQPGGGRKKQEPQFKRDIKEIATLTARIAAETPELGHEATFSKQNLFSELPISGATLAGLAASTFTSMTKVITHSVK